MKLKLNWFSPLPPARSGIADYVWHVLPALRELAEVTLWTRQAAWDPGLEDYARVERYPVDDDFWRRVNLADMTIYHIGNNPEFHADIWEFSCHHPGLVVLHDVTLQDLFIVLFLHYHQDAEKYTAAMTRYYGERGRRAAHRLIAGESTPQELGHHFPLTPLAVEKALAVVAHNVDSFEALRAYGHRPMVWSELPYEPTRRDRLPAKTSAPDGIRRLVVFGHLGKNRRLEPLFEAIAGMAGRKRLRLDVYGEILDEEAMRARRDALGLTDQVRFHGFVSSDRLHQALDRADLALNLRYPTMGESSLSQLLIWDHALPSVVTGAGWYSELPRDAVATVRMEHEIEDIQSHLDALLSAPEDFYRLGEGGRRLLEQQHSPARYARTLVKMASLASERRLQAMAFQLARRVNSELELWDGLRTRAEVAQSVGEALHSLFGADVKAEAAVLTTGSRTRNR